MSDEWLPQAEYYRRRGKMAVKHRVSRPTYTEEEEHLLEQLYMTYPFTPMEVICERLGRNENAVRSKLSEMGLKRGDVLAELVEGMELDS
jgi:hypothetical protein